MDITFIIEDAVANAVKFTLDSEPSDVRANFDQRRYAQVKNATVDEGKVYKQKFEKTDTIRLEFYSNFPLNRVKIVDCHDTVYGSLMFPAVAVQYRNLFYRSSCKLSSVDGKLFIYFADSRLYLDEDFSEEGEVIAYGGRLPNINAVPGDIFRYSLDGENFTSGIITAILWNTVLQVEGYLTDIDITLINPVDGYVEINYDEKPANLYAQLISLESLPEGTFFIRREHGVQGYTVSFTTEPLEVAVEHPETLALEYRHEGTYNRPDLWNYIYLEDWKNVIRIPADFYKFAPTGEVELDVNDFGVSRILRAVPFRQIELTFHNMPSWLADKLQIALSHDVKIINGYEYEVENFGQFELIDRLDLGNYVVNLRQKDDRAKKTDSFTLELTAEFVPPAHVDIPFSGGVVFSTFYSNTPFVFHFVAVPPGMLSDNPTFVDGDFCSWFVGPNPGLTIREFTLLAVCAELPGLIAEVTFTQLFDDSPAAEFLEVDTNEVSLSYLVGSNAVVLVNASGDYDISFSGPTTFLAVKESGGTQVRITVPSANTGSATRDGVVILTLQSNGAIQQIINVVQGVSPPSLVSITPDFWEVPNLYRTKNFNVVTQSGVQWQAMSSHSWIHVSTAIRTGDGILNVQVDAGDFYDIPRSGVVTLVNISNPYNTLVITIEQS